MTADDATLFDEADDPEVEPVAQSQAGVAVGPVVFLTNRYNLLDFLSSGMIVPKGAISKYYEDLLRLSPGRIPLLRGPVDQSLVDVVTAEDETAYPVLLELDPEVVEIVSGPVLPGSASRSLADPAAVSWAPVGAIPIAGVLRTHFRSQDELDEHLARDYENVPNVVAPVVTPELFGKGAVQLEDLIGFVEGVGPADDGLVSYLDRADRVAGARLGALAGAPPDASALRELLRMMSPRTGRRPKTSVLPDFLSAAVADRKPEDLDADGALFAAAVDVLARVDRSSSWRPVEILRSVESMLEEAKPSPEDAAEFELNMKPIEGVVRNERDFEPFGEGGLVSAKALLMVLLRPDVERIIEWPTEESGASDAVQVAACALAGLLRGRKRMSLELRPGGLDDLMSRLIVRELSAGALSDLRVASIGDASVEEGDESVWISVGGTVVLSKEKPPPTLAELFMTADFEDSSVRDVAVAICRKLDWFECFSIVVRGSDCVVKVADSRDDPSFVFAGSAKVTHELDTSRFMDRIRTADSETELAMRARERLALSGGRASAK